jgi:beta-alanine degradation protein BauB
MNRVKAVAGVQVDNDRVRITEWRFAPGAATGFHRHEHDYCVVPLTGGTLRLEARDGVFDNELAAGRSYFNRAGVEHDVVNINDFEFAFIEIEVK